jgi:hypothetical protein
MEAENQHLETRPSFYNWTPRLLAERQMGAFLKTMPKNPGGYAPTVKAGGGTVTLAGAGITYKQSSNAQKLAAIPADEFKERVEAAKFDDKRALPHVFVIAGCGG